MSSAPTSTDGQPLGRRGVLTRQRILTAVAGAIEQQGLRGLRLADVASDVGFSPPAFYQYFNDLDEAILALCEEVGELLPTFSFGEADESDGAESEEDGSREFVARFLEYWDDHRALLWARNAAVTAGDARFQTVRDESFRPMVEALGSRIEAAQRAGRMDASVSPVSLGAVLTVMLDRVAMLSPQLLQYWGAKDSEVLVESVAYVLDRVLGVPDDRGGRRSRAGVGRRSGRRRTR